MDTRIRLRASLQASSALLVLFGGSAGAAQTAEAVQTAQSTQSAGDSYADNQLGVIVVTAQRHEENLQDVPISITTLSQDDLSTRGIVSAQDMQGLLPGVDFQPNNDLFVSVRGIGTFNLQPGVDSAVAYTVDGNYIAHPAQLPTLLYDLDHVEVLRGPQGTLFGRNANAGAINFITNRPTDEFEVHGAVGFGNYDLLHTEVAINAPIAEGFAIRASGATQRHDPYLDDGHNDEDQVAARLRALIEPSENVSLLVTLDYNHREDNNIGVSECPPNAVEAACANVRWDPFDGNDNPNPDDYSVVETWGAYAQLDVQLGDFATLTYIPTYRESNLGYITTPTYPYVGTIDNDSLHTEEVRLASLPNSPIDWVVGAYYSRERADRVITYYWPNGPIPRDANNVINFFNVDYYESESYAAFAQVTVPLTDALRLTGGIRYTDESKTSRGTANAYAGTIANPVLVSIRTDNDTSDERVTWRAGVEFDATPDNLLYASVSTGFKSGGVSQADPSIALPTTYGPETITAYQVGSKNRFLDGRLQINAEFFYYDYSGFQTLLPSFQPSGLLYFLTVNSQKARFFGGEIEATWLVTPHDQIDGSIALLDAEFTKFIVGPNDFSGNEPAHAPAYTINLGYQHTFDFANGGALTARAESRVVDNNYVSPDNFPGGRVSTYIQSNANLTYEGSSGGWSVTAWIRNIENNGIIYNANPPGTQPFTLGYLLPPRTFGVTVRAGF